MQNGLNTGQGGIAGSLAQSVDGGMNALASAQHGGQHIGDGQVVIIVGVEVEMQVAVTLHHLPHVFYHVQRIEYAQGVGQHEALDVLLAQGVHHLVDIVRRFLHAAAPVFEINVDAYAQLVGIVNRAADIVDVFLGLLLQLIETMTQRAFTQEIDVLATALVQPV